VLYGSVSASYDEEQGYKAHFPKSIGFLFVVSRAREHPGYGSSSPVNGSFVVNQFLFLAFCQYLCEFPALLQ
jgi:hypothetical protein